MASITNCPKCGSERIAFAHEEAPPWANKWTKCFACGKRWNLDGGPPKRKPNENEEGGEAVDFTPPAKLDRSQDIVALVMKAARTQAETPPTKEPVMSGPAPDSRRCREILKKGTRCVSGVRKGEDVCKYHFEKRLSAKPTKTVTTLPARRATSPIVMADPTILEPVPIGRADSPELPQINNLIALFEKNLVTLRGAKELIELHG